MTKHVNAESIIRGNFCDIVKFFRGRDLDAVDRLAQRALSVIFRTDHLVQTGNEVDADPFTANMFASAALTSINRTLRTYPFVRASSEAPEADEDAVFASAAKQIESAERLSPDPRLLAIAENAMAFYQQMLGDPNFNAYRGVGPAAVGIPHASWSDFGAMEHAGTAQESDGDVVSTPYYFSPSRRLLVLTDGFKNDEAGYERAMAASAARWLPLDISGELRMAMEERRHPAFDHPALKIPKS